MVAAILVFAPLFRGGNRPLPLLVLECLGLLALALVLWQRSPRELWKELSTPLRWGLAILVVTPLVQLVPLPEGLWARLPGHEPYARVLEHAAGAASSMRPISVHPRATEYSWLVLIPCTAVFLAMPAFGRRQVRKLVLLFIGVAMAEILLGILQSGAGRDSLLHLDNPYGGGGATGTYINRNHFVALVAMALPLLVAIWASETLPTRDAHGEVMRAHPRHADVRTARRIAWSIAVVLALAALLLSRSRAGIALGLAAFGATSLALVWSAGTTQVRVLLGGVAALALLLAAFAGLTPIVARFGPDELSMGYEGRLRLSAAALRAGMDFLPFGSGLGTFGDVFQRYQGEGLVGYIDHAHNDYAEVFVELGIAGVVAIALLAVAFVARWNALLHAGASRTLGLLQVAAGFSLLAMAVHGFFDFNFHIPANAIYFCFLAGVFFYEPTT